MRIRRALYLLFFILYSTGVYAQERPLICGIALGYPPYQFQNAENQPVGIDVDIAREVARRIGRKLVFDQRAWDDVVSSLRLNQIDCISGIEINSTRKNFFDFTKSYYTRKIVIVALADNEEINNLKDLKWKVITGDRHSSVEKIFQELGLKQKIRIHQTKSKNESMRQLKNRNVVAMIAPAEVAFYLAKKHDVKLKLLNASDPGSPVGMAVSFDNSMLRKQINEALDAMLKDKTLEGIIRRWRGINYDQ